MNISTGLRVAKIRSSSHVPNPSQSNSEPRIAEPFVDKRKNIRPESRKIRSLGVLFLLANASTICSSKSDREGFGT